MKRMILWLGLLVVSGIAQAAVTNRIEIAPLFFGPPTHEYPLFKEPMSEEKLSRILDNMKADGINMVLFLGGWGEKAYYPSMVLKEPSETDWYEIAFEMAADRKIEVVLPGAYYTYNDQFTTTPGKWNPQLDLEVNKKVYAELNERYGHHSNFWGWYIPHETGDRTHRGDIMVILKNLPPFLKKLTPNKKVAHAPWFPSRITLGDDDALTPAETAVEWDVILSEVDGIDVLLFQDTTAPIDQIPDYYAAVKPVLNRHGVELWATVELFHRFQDRPGIELFESIPPELLFKKMAGISPYAERFACFEYQTHLDPDSETPGAKELNAAYKEWLKERGE